MKAVLMLTVLTVMLLLPEGGDAGWFRSVVRKVTDVGRKAVDKVKGTVSGAVRKVKDTIRRLPLHDRRDLEDFDLNQDGAIDQSEMEVVIGERQARDLWSIMDVDDALPLEEFERNLRDLEDFEDEE